MDPRPHPSYYALIHAKEGHIMGVKKKNPAAVKLGRLGGKARAENLTAEELSEIGKKGGRPKKKKAKKDVDKT